MAKALSRLSTPICPTFLTLQRMMENGSMASLMVLEGKSTKTTTNTLANFKNHRKQARPSSSIKMDCVTKDK